MGWFKRDEGGANGTPESIRAHYQQLRYRSAKLYAAGMFGSTTVVAGLLEESVSHHTSFERAVGIGGYIVSAIGYSFGWIYGTDVKNYKVVHSDVLIPEARLVDDPALDIPAEYIERTGQLFDQDKQDDTN